MNQTGAYRELEYVKHSVQRIFQFHEFGVRPNDLAMANEQLLLKRHINKLYNNLDIKQARDCVPAKSSQEEIRRCEQRRRDFRCW